MIANDLPAPVFSLPDLNGKLYSLDKFRGQVVIVNFWSAECPHAARVDGDLLSLLAAWKDKVALLTIAANANEPPALLRSEAQARGIPLLLHDADQAVADLYGAVTTPHLFVVDAQGILRYQGAFDDVTFRQRTPTRSYLREAVEAVLAGQNPDPAQTQPYGCTVVRFLVG